MRIFFVVILLVSTLFSAQKLQKVSLQLQWLDQFQFAGYYIAKEKGFYEDVGLDVELRSFKSNIVPVDEVIKGKADFGIGRTSLLIDSSEGKDIVALAAIFQTSPLVLLGIESKDLKSIKDFVGKNLMCTTDAKTAAPLIAMIQSQGVKIEDMNFVNHSFNTNDLINKKTDLMASYISNEPFKLAKKGIDSVIFDPKDYGFDFYSDILFTSSEQVTNHYYRVKNFKEASLKGWRYAFDNIEETVDIIYHRYNNQNKTKQELRYEASELKRLAYYKNKKLGDIDAQKIKRVLDIYSVLGLLKQKVNIDKFIYDSYVYRMSQKDKDYLDLKKDIKVCIDPYWKPFEYIEDKEHKGITADFLKIFSELIGKDINLVPTKSWAESKRFAKDRKCDILAAASYTKQRAGYLDFTTPYLSLPYVVATQVDTPYIYSIDQIKNKKIGMVKGYSFIATLKQRYPDIKIVEFKNLKEGLGALRDKKIFAFIDTASTIGYALRKNNIINIKIGGQLKDLWQLRIATRNDEPQLNEIFQNAVDSLSDDQISKVLNKWHTIKYDQEVDYTLLWQLFIGFLLVLSLFGIGYYNLRKAKKLAEESFDNIHKILDTTIEAISVSDEDFKIMIINKSALDIFGYTKEEFLNLYVTDVIADDSIEKAKEAFEKQNPKQYELNLVKKDGTIFPALASGKDIVYMGKKARVSTIVDLTQLKETQKELEKLNNELELRVSQEVAKNTQKENMLYQQSRLAQMGEMISMIAHQWRQPLASISLNIITIKLKLELKKFDLNSPNGVEQFLKYLDKNLTEVESYLQSLSSTIDDFRNFYKPNKKSVKIDITEPIIKSLNIVRVSLSEDDITILENYESKRLVKLYDSEIMQVILNILKNAQDNFKTKDMEGKKIVIKTYEKKDSINIEICDNGGGIDKSIIEKIFDPYFSTKSEKNGTGLGLHMSRIIVEEHHKGILRAYNKDGGASFVISLPI
jgi:PAS domain S-box-containing protein